MPVAVILIVSIILLVLAALGVRAAQVDFGWLGLAFLAGASLWHALGGKS